MSIYTVLSTLNVYQLANKHVLGLYLWDRHNELEKNEGGETQLRVVVTLYLYERDETSSPATPGARALLENRTQI